MPLSLILHLQSPGNGRIHGATGRAVHGFWLNHWQTVAPTIANALHHTRDTQPFTLSPLMGLPRPQQGYTTIPKGSTAWLRLALLDDTLIPPLLETWLPRLPAHIQLADLPWEITHLSLTPHEHPWARQETYPQLSHLPAKTEWHFQLLTPTAFHFSHDAHLPFPLPRILLHSWLRRWNAFAPQPMPPSYDDLFRDELLISDYQLQTIPMRYGRRLTIGCIGQFTLQPHHLTPTQHAHLTTLAHYAFYCGSGVHTTQGMGITRVI